jgi:uncharacterized glyoxalase superfamily protein PhnB
VNVTSARRTAMTPAFNRIIPILRIFDVGKAREFYVDYLGFSVDFEHRYHEGAPLFMQVSRGNVVLRLSEHHGDGSPGVHVTVEMSGVQEFHQELGAKGYRYMNPGIVTSEWGTRDLNVIDPFGNVLNFTDLMIA